jgi:hypothetical protein
MLDPREQKKGGFGAFVAREQERNEVREAANAKGSTASTDPTFVPPSADSAADAVDDQTRAR